MRHEWIVIANAARARVLEQGPSRRLALLWSLDHAGGRMRSSMLGDDKAGLERPGRGLGGAAFEPRLDAQRRQRQEFARELAQLLEESAQEQRYEAAQLFAASPFLGELQNALGPATTRLLAGAHDVDLSAVGLAELPARIEQALA